MILYGIKFPTPPPPGGGALFKTENYLRTPVAVVFFLYTVVFI